MASRFSSEELFFLRNNLPIRLIITAVLKLNSKDLDGIFRFQCPSCHGFNTATNTNTNLARCFSCMKNYNPIDLVMTVRNISFRDSVSLLKKLSSTLPSNNNQQSIPAPLQPTPAPQNAGLYHISKILAHYKLIKQ